MKINLKLNFNANSLDTLKYFLLYFDKVNVYIPSKIYNDKTDTFINIAHKTDIFQQLDYLKKQKIVSFDYSTPVIQNPKIDATIMNSIGQILLTHSKDFYKSSKYKYNKDTKQLTIQLKKPQIPNQELLLYCLNCMTKKDAKSIHSFIDLQKYLQIHDLFDLTQLFLTTLADLYNNNNVATNCNFLNKFMYHYYNEIDINNSNFFVHNYISQNCLKILLPNISSLSIEDILEIKIAAKDELFELKSYINEFSTKSLSFDINTTDFEDLAKTIQSKLNTSIDCFNRKCQNIKYNIAQKFITELKNPLSYSPLLLSLYRNIPTHIELLASSLLISSTVLLEYFKQSNDLKNDSLYFTYTISNFFR